MLHVARFSFDDIEISYVLHVLWITSYFHSMGQWATIEHDDTFRRVCHVAVPARRQTTTVFGWVHQSAIDNCFVLYVLVAEATVSKHWKQYRYQQRTTQWYIVLAWRTPPVLAPIVVYSAAGMLLHSQHSAGLYQELVTLYINDVVTLCCHRSHYRKTWHHP